MRTTLNLDDDLARAAKQLAHDQGATLTSVIEDALRELFAQCRTPPDPEPYEVMVTGGGGLMPGVDLDDSAGLLEIMEADGTWH